MRTTLECPMRKILFAVIAAVFLLYTTLVPAASMHSCCHDQDCPVTRCAVLGSPPARRPLAPVLLLPMPPAPPASTAVIGPAVVALPPPLVEIWTPPD